MSEIMTNIKLQKQKMAEYARNVAEWLETFDKLHHFSAMPR
jgi:predicted ATP-grasp superfamily ATP-dependent carboligase